MAIKAITKAIKAGSRQRLACELIGITARTLQNWNKSGKTDRRKLVKKEPSNKLTTKECEAILALCNNEEFKNQSPKQIVPTLADRNIFLASESSFYRILKKENQLNHRRRSAQPKATQKPHAYQANGPNQVWSWDITYLASDIKGVFYYLYLFMDIYSRKIVGWEIYENESSSQAADVLRKIRLSEGLAFNQNVVLHSDNGSPMKGATMMATMQKLGVIPSFSRPSVSNDNPFSEALFKTLKYVQNYPSKPFDSIQNARQWMKNFEVWYNQVHRHSELKFVTPAQRHNGEDVFILASRKKVYEAAKKRRPDRWSGKIRNWDHLSLVKLNPNDGPKHTDREVKKAA
jgi:putative transposase